jgi:S1-C subfamily serine protease
MKRALVAASVALFLADACGVAVALPPDRIFDRVAPGVWSVHAFGADGKLLASGNGLSVAPGRLVTSCRTLARARRVELRQGGKVYDAKLEFPDVERDLCQLHVPGLNAPVLAQGSARTLRPGQRVYVIGFSLGDQTSIADGLVSAVRDAGGPNERIQTTVPAAGGLLGAGVFDEEARLVGLITSSPGNAAATAFAVPADWLAELAARGQAVLASRVKPAAKTGASREGMPAAGSQWVYGFIDRQFGRRPIDVTVRAERVAGTSVDEAVISSRPSAQETQRSVSAGESRFFTHRLADGAELTEFAPYFLAANGEKASTIAITAAGYPVGSGNPSWITQTEPPTWEQVTVPAGTFRALRLEISGKRERSPFSPIVTYRFKVRIWYAPEVQRYVRLEHMEWLSDRQASDVVVELVKFSPPS